MMTRAARVGPRGQPDASGIRVLLIDDEMEFAELYKHGLEINGDQVRVAADGITGLRLCRSWSPDLVLLDMKLALMDGPALLRELRRSSDGKRIRVVALTNYTKSEVESADPDLLGDLPWLLKLETTPHDLVRWIRSHLVLEEAGADGPASQDCSMAARIGRSAGVS